MTERVERIWLAAIVTFGIALFASTLLAGFTFDDANSVRGHVGVHGPLSFKNIVLRDYWGLPFDQTAGSWRPFATLTYWVDWHVGSGSPWVFHLSNLLWWGALLLLINAFLRRWGGDALTASSRLLALAAFAALAIHTDVVPGATGRTELLAMTFSLASMLVVMTPGPRMRAASIAAAGLFLLLALLSKESAFPMAIVVPWFAWRFHRRNGAVECRRLAALTATCVVVLAAMVVFRAGKLPFVKKTFEMLSDNPLHTLPLWKQKLGAAEVFTHYLQHTITGLDLVPDYSYSAIHVLQNGFGVRTAIGVALVAGLVLLAFRMNRATPQIADAVVGFGGSYLVASHFVVPASAMVADRLFFFPSFWLVVLGALLMEMVPHLDPKEASKRLGLRKILAGAAAAWILVQGVLTAAATTLWHNDAVLLTQAIQTYPHVARTRVNFSKILTLAGHHEEAAWHSLLAHAYYTRFPHPIQDHEFPLAWDDLPMEERLAALRAEVGDALFLALVDRAAETCSEWNQPESASVLKEWRRRHTGPVETE